MSTPAFCHLKPRVCGRFVSRLFVMGKVSAAMIKKKMERVHKRMPFVPEESPTIRQPRSMKDRQQLWLLAGLKHLKAPIAPMR